MKVNESKKTVQSKPAKKSAPRIVRRGKVAVDSRLDKYAGKDFAPEKTAAAKRDQAAALAAVAAFRAGMQHKVAH